MHYNEIENMKGRIVQTFPSKLIGCYRIALGTIFMFVGALKLTLDVIRHAWCIQLTEIKIPYCIIFFWMIPLLEILAGTALILGFLSRVAAFVVLPILTVAIYVYLNVSNPQAFLALPYEAYLPSITIMLATTIFIYGGGSWSMDLKMFIKK